MALTTGSTYYWQRQRQAGQDPINLMVCIRGHL
jgi:hypothetical protein